MIPQKIETDTMTYFSFHPVPLLGKYLLFTMVSIKLFHSFILYFSFPFNFLFTFLSLPHFFPFIPIFSTFLSLLSNLSFFQPKRYAEFSIKPEFYSISLPSLSSPIWPSHCESFARVHNFHCINFILPSLSFSSSSSFHFH